MGGTGKRMKELAVYLRTLIDPNNHDELVDLTASGNRYSIYKVGPVLCCSHGVGMSSMGVVLHELIKLVHYADCNDPVFLRVGTSGGIAFEPGTVVVSDKAYNAALEAVHEIFILGNRVCRETVCFYEGQARTDGASCDYTDDDKMIFLKKCEKLGIRNIEMEATMFSSLTLKTGIRAGAVCVTFLDRLIGDQVDITSEQKIEWENRPLLIVGLNIQRILGVGN